MTNGLHHTPAGRLFNRHGLLLYPWGPSDSPDADAVATAVAIRPLKDRLVADLAASWGARIFHDGEGNGRLLAGLALPTVERARRHADVLVDLDRLLKAIVDGADGQGEDGLEPLVEVLRALGKGAMGYVAWRTPEGAPFAGIIAADAAAAEDFASALTTARHAALSDRGAFTA